MNFVSLTKSIVRITLKLLKTKLLSNDIGNDLAPYFKTLPCPLP